MTSCMMCILLPKLPNPHALPTLSQSQTGRQKFDHPPTGIMRTKKALGRPCNSCNNQYYRTFKATSRREREEAAQTYIAY